MSKILVVLTVRMDDGEPAQTEEVTGQTWGVDPAGVLTVFDASGDQVASFAAGKWLRVKRL